MPRDIDLLLRAAARLDDLRFKYDSQFDAMTTEARAIRRVVKALSPKGKTSKK